MSGWMHGRKDASTYGRRDAWVSRERHGWADGRTRGCTDATKAKRMTGLMYSCEHTWVGMISPMGGLVVLLDDCFDVRALGRINGWLDRWANVCVDVCIECADAWVDGPMDGRMHAWAHVWVDQGYGSTHVSVDGCEDGWMQR